jgi:hypothetical protein
MQIRKPKWSNINTGVGGPGPIPKPIRKPTPRSVSGPHPREAARKVVRK